jgi:hypothetical protein
LTLAGLYNDEDPRVYTKKAAYISLLKAPPSWAMAANIHIPVKWQQDKENTTEATNVTLQCQQHETKHMTEAAANTRPQQQRQQDKKENTTETANNNSDNNMPLKVQVQDKENDVDASIFNSVIHVNVIASVHAKCASGVLCLMSAVNEKAVVVLSKGRLDSPPPLTGIVSRWGLCRHLFFGNFTSEDTCTQSPFSE